MSRSVRTILVIAVVAAVAASLALQYVTVLRVRRIRKELKPLIRDVARLRTEVDSALIEDPPDSDWGLHNYSQGGVVVDSVAYFTGASIAPTDRRPNHHKSRNFPYVVAFNVDDFTKIRTYNIRDTYDSAPLVITKRDGTRLVIAHECEPDRTVAVNARTGNVEWLTECNQPTGYFFGYSYYIRDDAVKILLMAAHNGLHANSAEDGKELWAVYGKTDGGVTPCVDQTAGLIYYQCSGELMKIRAQTGQVLKTVSVPDPSRCVSWNTVLVNDSHGHYIATYWYGRPEWDSAIRVYDRDLNLVWERTGLPLYKKATLTYVDGKLVTGSGNGRSDQYVGSKWKYVAAYAISTGKILWKCDLSAYGYRHIANVPYYNGYFYAESQDTKGFTSKLFRIRASDGKLADVYDYKRPITSCAPSIIARGRMFSGDLFQDKIVVTRIAEGSKADWIGPFCDPQTNTYALPDEQGAKNVPMKELTCPRRAETE